MFLYGIFFLLNIVSLSFSNNKIDPIYMDFDPQDKNQYRQVLELMEQNQICLLDPDEDPAVALQEYKNALLGKPKRGLDGLQLKLLMTADRDKVIGFISYLPQKSNKKLPYMIRTIAIDAEYKRLGLGTLLLSKIEQEAEKNGHPQTCLAVYSFNDDMLNLIKKRSYHLCASLPLSGYTENTITGKREPIFTFITCKELKKPRL